jgi:hypothetical protein
MQPHHCAALITCMAHESSDRTLGFTGAQVTWQILTLLSSTLLMRFSRRRSSTTSSSSCKMRRREEWTARPGGTRTHSHQHVVGAVFERFIDLSEGDSTLCGLCISSIWLAPTGILKASQLWMSGRPLLLRSRTAACNSDIYLDPLSSPFRIDEPHLGSSGLRLRKRVGRVTHTSGDTRQARGPSATMNAALPASGSRYMEIVMPVMRRCQT